MQDDIAASRLNVPICLVPLRGHAFGSSTIHGAGELLLPFVVSRRYLLQVGYVVPLLLLPGGQGPLAIVATPQSQGQGRQKPAPLRCSGFLLLLLLLHLLLLTRFVRRPM
jgi:hypothetical protein